MNVVKLHASVGVALVAKMFGFEATEMEMGYRGLDAIFFHLLLGKYLIIEAKGGTSKLNQRSSPAQMTHAWIEKNLKKAIKKNKAYGGNQKAEAELVEDEMLAGNQFLAAVVSRCQS